MKWVIRVAMSLYSCRSVGHNNPQSWRALKHQLVRTRERCCNFSDKAFVCCQKLLPRSGLFKLGCEMAVVLPPLARNRYSTINKGLSKLLMQRTTDRWVFMYS